MSTEETYERLGVPDAERHTVPDATGVMPAAFIGHGSPMNAIEHNRYTDAWSMFAASMPTPTAILVVSAHWYVNITAVTAMRVPRTIHDFYGFPQPLFDVTYPAPGNPELAQRITDIVEPTYVGLDADSWGIDHGTWSVLRHMYPSADVPVLQLSINAELPFDYHFNLGVKLHQLRSEGVLIIGSGNVVHNLRLVDWHSPGQGTDWAHRFDDAMRDIMTHDASELGTASAHGDYAMAVPTPDHFLPLAYVAGLAAAAKTPATTIIDGYEMGSLSMTAYQLRSA
ncbi:MAG: 4,5-DOPA dioxygenase extradiol [Acidimicrobiales bacterium]|jgi:4,5-DOPA dioxygenase extradiol